MFIHQQLLSIAFHHFFFLNACIILNIYFFYGVEYAHPIKICLIKAERMQYNCMSCEKIAKY